MRTRRSYRPRGQQHDPVEQGAGRLDPRPSAEALADRDRRLNYVETLHMALLGDPPPGRSALDGWIPRGVSACGVRERW
jgi:hypothetical protein